jgi:hypothetical protein
MAVNNLQRVVTKILKQTIPITACQTNSDQQAGYHTNVYQMAPAAQNEDMYKYMHKSVTVHNQMHAHQP